jgi:hypothetical protein
MMRLMQRLDAAAFPIILIAIAADVFYFKDIVATRVVVLIGMIYGAVQLHRQRRKEKTPDARR